MTMMKAIQVTQKEEGLKVIEIEKPLPEPSELLVQVKYSAIDTCLDSIATNDFASAFIHDMKSTPLRAGNHFSGVVQATGSAVPPNLFAVGDAVFGHLQYAPSTDQGAFGEYVTVLYHACATKPDNVPWDVAAACTTEALTALQAMRDLARLESNKTVLILGAGGSVGAAAVGIAKCLGASSVTAVCSAKDVERVQKLGADIVINRSNKKDWEKEIGQYDVVFDVPSAYHLWTVTGWLKKKGGFVNTIPVILDIMWFGPLWGWLTGKTFKSVLVESKQQDLELVGQWLSSKALTIEIDSTYNISDMNAAWEHFQKSSKKGRVVIKVEGAW